MEAVSVKKKSKKKWIITLVIITAVIAVIFAACSALTAKAKKSLEALTAMEVGQVEVRDLISSVGATGKVISLRSKDLTANLSGVEISAIHVEVGDRVEAGQELATFNTEDIADDLTRAQRALYQSQQRNELSAGDAQRGVDDAIRNSDFQVETAARNVDTAYENYNNAQEDLRELCDDRQTAWEEWQDAEREYNRQYSRQRDIEKRLLPQLEQEQEDLEDIGWDSLTGEQQERLNQLREDIPALRTEMATLTASLPQAEAAAKTAEAAYEQTDSAVKNMERSLETMFDNYESAVRSYDNMVAAQASSVAAAQSGKQSVEVSANTDQQQKQVELYADQLKEGKLTAPFGGIVTAVNYDPGDTYLQGPIVTVQDCSGFEISAQIGQYDISDIALGQKVLIKTDATREQELNGTVVFISPVATGGVPADPTYEVKISVDTQTDRLRLDMSANLSILITEHKNCLTVPYNAVQTAEDGSTFVEVVGEDESLTVVPVKILLESNYYTEVSGDLTEGQQVRVISEGSSMADMFGAMMTEMEGG